MRFLGRRSQLIVTGVVSAIGASLATCWFISQSVSTTGPTSFRSPAQAQPIRAPKPVPRLNHLQKAVDTVRLRAARLAEAHPDTSPVYWTALEAMNYVQSKLSSVSYSVLSQQGRTPAGVDACLLEEAGICGAHALTFRMICFELGVKTRNVQFFNLDLFGGQSHVLAEVWFNDKWNTFDISWGTIYRRPGGALDELLSIEELRGMEHPRELAISNSNNPWHQHYVASGLDPFDYLDSTRVDILSGGNGTIRFDRWDQLPKSKRALFTNLPRDLGSHADEVDGSLGTTRWRLMNIPKTVDCIVLGISHVKGNGELKIGQKGELGSMALSEMNGKPSVRIDLPDPLPRGELSLFVEPAHPDQRAYLHCHSITLLEGE